MQKLSTKETINKVLLNFDFEKVHQTMALIGWYWSRNNEYKIPSQVELLLTAQDLLTEAASNCKSCTVSTGGLEAEAEVYPDGELVLSLKFVLTSFNYSTQDTCY